ncbi:MAG TPA: ABC transporter ATP-binding protein [Dongiaceae bacterium]|nr:ABC transporter ATP-binding protein [Dongiaceae bacterium]
MAFLELNNVSKGYGSGSRRVAVLRDIDLSIAEGEFVAIVGYSGAGKTTLMSLIAGLQRPDTGTVQLRGEEVREPGPDRAIVFQNYSLLPWLSVYENIALAVGEVFPQWPAAQRREHIEKYIAMVNLTPARDKKPRELSGGMRQRVSVARALAMNPRILLLDEPLSALDALTRAVLQDEIGRIWSEDRKTVVLITNDVDEGILLADRIIPLSAGPGATLGPAVAVDIERPRDRKALNHHPSFKAIRKEVIGYLLGAGGRPKSQVTRKLVLPDIEPEDLTGPQALFAGRRVPRRRGEEKNETVKMDL